MKTIFIKFLVTYFLILLFPVILGWVIYDLVLGEFETYIKNTHITLLHQTMEIIDRYTKEVEWKVFQIANNSKLKNLIYSGRQESIDNMLLIREIVNELAAYVIYSSNFNSTFYVYLKEQDLILTPNASYHFEDFIRGEVFFRIEGISAAAWHEKILSRYYPGTFLETKRMIIEDYDEVDMPRMVPYIQSLPLGYNKSINDVTGVILYIIREDEFNMLLENLNIPRGGWAYIADESGKMIAGISHTGGSLYPVDYSSTEQEGLKKLSLSGKEMFAIYTTSSVNHWKYTAVLPARFVLDKVRIIKSVSLIAILIATVISILLSIIISYRRAKPFNKVIGLIRENSGSTHPGDLSNMNVLSGSISGLINKSSELQQQLQKQRQFVCTALFDNLLHGHFRNDRECSAFLSYAGFTIEEQKFIVLLLNLPGYETLGNADIIEELHKVKVIVHSTWERIFSGKTFFHDLDERKTALIAALQEEDNDICYAYITGVVTLLLTDMAACCRIKLQAGVGNICRNLMEINSSFEQAKEALNYLLKSEKEQIINFRDIHGKTQEYYFPLELEMRLLNAAKAGDKAQVSAIIEMVHEENFRKRSILPEKQRELLYEMHGTLVKIKNQTALDIPEFRMDIKRPAEDVFVHLQKVYLEICGLVDAHKKSHNTHLIKRIKAYLEAEYNNPNLCLYSVSSHFALNETYLSFFFKEQTGMNFSYYLERLRIDHAVKLLLDSCTAINDIARYAGYHSDKTFRRVFKKVKGISPREFRLEQKRQPTTAG